MARLSGKTAIITGAANGIGAATAKLFGAEGASVLLLDIDAAGDDVARHVRAEGGIASFLQTEITNEDDVRHAAEYAEATYGRVDVLVNNAAVFILKGLEASVDDWLRSYEVNVVGAALCSRYAAAVMRKSGGGAIVNLCSISAFVAQPHFLTYSSTKAALVQMTRGMAMDLAPDIRVNCVCPGTIRTAATDRHMAQTGMSEEQFLAENAPLHLLNRIGRPSEVANAILFLASDEASFITGTALMVDGGYVAR